MAGKDLLQAVSPIMDKKNNDVSLHLEQSQPLI